MSPPALIIFAVYKGASDLPQHPFVVRGWEIRPCGAVVPQASYSGYLSLAAARVPLMRQGLLSS